MMMSRSYTRPDDASHRLDRYWGFAFLLAAIVAFIILADWLSFTQDDAFITFRYAANFTNGHGLVFNIGEHIEGYTNFLWTLLIILSRLAGLDLIVVSKILGIICGVISVFMLFITARYLFSKYFIAGLTALIMAGSLSFAYWSVSGLETAAFTASLAAVIYCYLKRSYLTAPLLVLATLIRPEGGLLFIMIILYEIIKERRMTALALSILSIYFISLAPYLAFKYFYYGGIIPNTFYAKTGLSADKLLDGLQYTAQFFWHYFAAGIFLLPAIFYYKKAPDKIKFISLLLLIYILYIILVGGDVLKVHRFFVPLLPPFILLIFYGLIKLSSGKNILVLSALIIIAWEIYIPIDHITFFHSREKGFTSKMYDLAQNLKAADKSDFSLAASTIGVIGYELLDHQVIDMLGLTDSVIARHPEQPVKGMESTWKERKFNSSYILGRQPDYILFSTGAKPSAPAERTLCLYSAFLKNYRTIALYFGGHLHEIYKRYYPVEQKPIRDINPDFVKYYVEGFNFSNEGKDLDAFRAYGKASTIVPDSIFPYPEHYMSEILRKYGRYDESYALIKKIYATDTLVYNTLVDLSLFEKRLRDDPGQAVFYRDKLAKLMPWYLPRLDSLLNGLAR